MAGLEDRFWSKVDRRGADECWPWTACCLRPPLLPYGRFSVASGQFGVPRRTVVLAHRAAFYLVRGRWPQPQGIHGCDNPLCCNAENPGHVHEGTQQQNVAEMYLRGRAVVNPTRGSSSVRAKLTAAQAAEVRERRARGEHFYLTAAEYGVSVRTIRRVVNRETYVLDGR